MAFCNKYNHALGAAGRRKECRMAVITTEVSETLDGDEPIQ